VIIQSRKPNRIPLKNILTTASITFALVLSLFQTASAQELHGSTLNLGLGIGGRQVSVFHINYEFDVAPAVTLAPFVSFYDYSNFIPIGLKGSFYFDDMLSLDSNWDLYAAASLGLGLVSDEWDNQYHRDRYRFRGPNALFFDFHLGAEYRFTPRVGMFLDLSSGSSLIGIALH